MNGIDVMLEEHDNILTFIQAVRGACCRVLEGEAVDIGDFRDMVLFARTYADHHHHGKEEKILFREMTQRLGPVAGNLIQHGMLVEHDLGRLYLTELEAALNRYEEEPSTVNKLDILTHASGWGALLERHAQKENAVVFPLGRRELPPEVLQTVDQEVEAYERQAQANGTQQNALDLLQRLCTKYC